MSIKVKAVETGFYGLKRRIPGRKGSVFLLKKVSDFSPAWMKVVECSEAEAGELKRHLEDMEAKASAPKVEVKKPRLSAAEAFEAAFEKEEEEKDPLEDDSDNETEEESIEVDEEEGDAPKSKKKKKKPAKRAAKPVEITPEDEALEGEAPEEQSPL